MSPFCATYTQDPRVRRILERLNENGQAEFVHRATPPDETTRWVILFGNRLVELDHVTDLGVWYTITFEGRAVVDPSIRQYHDLVVYFHTESR